MKTTALGIEHANREQVEEAIEAFRSLVLAARSSDVGPAAREAQRRLNAMYRLDPKLFTAEDVRRLTALSAHLGLRLESLRPRSRHTPAPMRAGDTLDHCWRCETPVDERFTETCPACSPGAFAWMVCPVCRACGCQRSGKAVV